MKLIGLIGGMSWRSTVEYYRLLNELVEERLGGLHSARIALYSVDFEPLAQAQHNGNWDYIRDELIAAGKALKDAGADFLLLGANTMHRVADNLETAVGLPLVHIADAAGEAIIAEGIETVGLLGTDFTMEGRFYRGRIEERFGIRVIIPSNKPDRNEVHRIIYEELCRGSVLDESKDKVLKVIGNLERHGARGIILGCTELPLLVQSEDVAIPLFDTTLIHARAAVETALK